MDVYVNESGNGKAVHRTSSLLGFLSSLLKEEGIEILDKIYVRDDADNIELIPQMNLSFFRMMEILFGKELSTYAVPLRYRGKHFNLEFDDDGCFLRYESQYFDWLAGKLRVRITNIIKSCKQRLNEVILRDKLVSKKIAIRNSFCEDIVGLHSLEKEIIGEYSQYRYGRGLSVPYEEDVCIEFNEHERLMSPSELEYLYTCTPPFEMENGKRPPKFKISVYIQAVFSFIEHCSMCLLPLWEKSNTSQWQIVKYNAVHFVPDTWTTFLLHKDDFMKLVASVFREENKALYSEYRSAKTDLRNVTVHGQLTSDQLENLTFSVPTLEGEFLVDFESSFNEVGFFSFLRVKHLLGSFLDYVEKINPVHYEILSSGLDIPADCSELLTYVGNDKSKVRDFVKRWEERQEKEDVWEC